MEIAPIPGIRTVAVTRTLPTESDLSAAFDIEALSKMGDGAAAARVKKAAGAEENDDDLDLPEGDGNEAGKDSSGVNCFA